MASSKHGSVVRGMDNVPHSSIRDQRFGRMFRYLPAAEFIEQGLVALARTMHHGDFVRRMERGEPVDSRLKVAEPENENPAIPSGYTYLGQFIDHDITFDPMSSLDRFNDPDALQDFRTPRLDLDSVYGSGPADQPFLYQADEAHLLLGEDRDFQPERASKPDLPRNHHFDEFLSDGNPRPIQDRAPRRALIGDKRNDENLIVSQLHATFLRFHNRVLDNEAGGDFALAQQIVRWHYQWIVLHDFLFRIAGQETYGRVIRGRGKMPVHEFYDAKGRYAYIPVEFSAAAYRYGHSQVRPSYSLSNLVKGPQPNEQPFGNGVARFNRIPTFSRLLPNDENQGRANLNGFRVLPGFWGIDWALYFDGIPEDGFFDPELQDGEILQPLPQPSYRIDSTLVDPLTILPEFMLQDVPAERMSLAVRNLLRGWRMGLPSGQSVARKMSIQPLDDEDLFDSQDEEQAEIRRALLADTANNFAGNCPLWYYLLREAEVLTEGAHLGPVGGTIVAEVLSGLILEDRHSFLAQWPGWTPTLPRAQADHFTMADLINYTEGRAPVPVAAA